MKKYTIISKQCENSNKIEAEIKSKIKLPVDNENPDIIFVIGGDGTILRAVHQFENIIDKVTIFGIHTGHLGFLANYTKDDIDRITSVLNCEFECKIEKQALVEYTLTTDKEVLNGIALNEITITSTPKLLTLDVFINGEYLETFKGDGLCISSPSGSTGYNKSLGGAVIDHYISTLQITEIAGLNSNSYRTLMSPLILSDRRKVEMIPSTDTDVLFTYDNLHKRFENVKKVEVKVSSRKIRFAYVNSVNFVKRVNRAFLNPKELS
ncbi:MAG: NAD kinase [bacterium]